jgi:hypothetical protein
MRDTIELALLLFVQLECVMSFLQPLDFVIKTDVALSVRGPDNAGAKQTLSFKPQQPLKGVPEGKR